MRRAGSFLTWTAEDEVWLREVGGMPEADIETIESERAAKEARSAAIVEAMRKSQVQKDQENGNEGDDEKAENLTIFAADPPDNNKRQRKERRLEKILEDFHARQKRRILKIAREMKGA